MSGLEHYRNGQKRNWRGWQWNRIVERLTVPVEEATVLYLCGPEDLDREKALARGFLNENLIAVDVDEKNVQRVRSRGGIGITGNLLSMLWSWPSDWPVDVVVADFCAGFDNTAIGLMYALFFSEAVSAEWPRLTVLSVNLQRGRDPQTNKFRDAIRDLSDEDWPLKHRGFQFYSMAINSIHQWLGLPEDADVGDKVAAPAGNSYRSNRVVMDSVVMRWPPIPSGYRSPPGVDESDDGVRRKIVACRAVRTMRLRRSA